MTLKMLMFAMTLTLRNDKALRRKEELKYCVLPTKKHFYFENLHFLGKILKSAEDTAPDWEYHRNAT